MKILTNPSKHKMEENKELEFNEAEAKLEIYEYKIQLNELTLIVYEGRLKQEEEAEIKKYSEKEQSIKELKDEIERLKMKNKYLETAHTKMKLEWKGEIVTKNHEIATLKELILILEEKVRQGEEKLNDFQTNMVMDQAHLVKVHEKYKDQIGKLEGEKSTADKKLDKTKIQNSAQKKRLEQVKEELADMSKRLRDTKASAEKNQRTLQAKLDKARGEKGALDKKLQQCKNLNLKQREKIVDQTKQLFTQDRGIEELKLLCLALLNTSTNEKLHGLKAFVRKHLGSKETLETSLESQVDVPDRQQKILEEKQVLIEKQAQEIEELQEILDRTPVDAAVQLGRCKFVLKSFQKKHKMAQEAADALESQNQLMKEENSRLTEELEKLKLEIKPKTAPLPPITRPPPSKPGRGLRPKPLLKTSAPAEGLVTAVRTPPQFLKYELNLKRSSLQQKHQAGSSDRTGTVWAA